MPSRDIEVRRATSRRYRKTEKGKATQTKYNTSKKGKDTYRRCYLKRKKKHQKELISFSIVKHEDPWFGVTYTDI